MPTKFTFDPSKTFDGETNGCRAILGEVACSQLPKYDQQTEGDNAIGTVCNILHFCDREGVNPEDVIRLAVTQWELQRGQPLERKWAIDEDLRRQLARAKRTNNRFENGINLFREFVTTNPKFQGADAHGKRKDWIATGDVDKWATGLLQSATIEMDPDATARALRDTLQALGKLVSVCRYLKSKHCLREPRYDEDCPYEPTTEGLVIENAAAICEMNKAVV